MTPRDAVWALVCGYPTGKREHRQLLMLQAYIDESESKREPQFLVLAGYIAPAEQWASFADDWDQALRTPPCINPFDIKDALEQTGPFYEKSKEDCNAVIARFRGIIEKHVSAGFSIWFRLDDYKKGFAANTPAKRMKNPYYFAAMHLLLSVARNLEGLGLQRGPVDFIYDNRVMEKPRLIEAWDWAAKQTKKPDPPDLLRLVPNPPQFQDDENVLPLQAADMLAKWTRLGLEAKMQGKVLGALPGFTRTLRGFIQTWSEDDFRQRALLDAEHSRNNP
jgi:hypothetical protein